MRKGYSLAGWCCMCRSDRETVSHLLLHCLEVIVLWSFIFQSFHIFFFFFFDKFQSFNIQRVLSGRVADLLLGWRNWLGKHSSDIWNLVHSCLIWTVWCERDSCTFEDKWSSVDSFLDYLLVHYLIGLGFWVSLLLKQLLFLIQLLLPI